MGSTSSIDELRAAIESGKALLVCGAGVSAAVAGPAAPNWKRLIESAIDKTPKDAGEDWSAACKANLASSDPDLWLSAAGIAQKKMGGCNGQPYRAWLKQCVGSLWVESPALLDFIKALNCRIATTNYDSLLCGHLGVQPKTWRNPSAVAEILSGESRNVWHIHGYWDEPDSVIFSSDDYNRVARSELAQFLQRSAAFTDTLIFIGCSNDGLADENIGRLLDWFEQNWTGLGKTHFALVRDADLSATGWPTSVTRVAYGAGYDQLPAFVRSLAPGPPDAANSIETLIPATPTFGRSAEIEGVVAAALCTRPCIITGAPGIGKTKVAIAAAYDPRVIERFGRRRIFVSLETRSDPLEIALLLASELGLKPEPKLDSALAAIRYSCERSRAFAILDNAEGLIEANQTETARILGLIANIPGLAVTVTSRESLIGLAGWKRIDDLPSLPIDEARALFCSIATAVRPSDPDLEPLLLEMDGHALSLTILASRVDSDLTLKPMLERWRREKAQLLTLPGAVEGRLNSVRASLRLSLTSKHMTGTAKRLLAILGFLPAGLPVGGLSAFLGREDRQLTREKSDAADDVLRLLRLITPRADGVLRLINPLRECISLEWPLRSPDLERVVRAGIKLLRPAGHFGTEKWPEAATALSSHIGNFAAILSAAGRVESIERIASAITVAQALASADNRLAVTIFLDLANSLRARPNSALAVASALFVAGDIARLRADFEGASAHLLAARAIFARLGNSLREAIALHRLGDLALRRNDLVGAETYLEAARAISVRIGSNDCEANTLSSLGNLALQRDDLEGAETHLRAACAISVRVGNNLGKAYTLSLLGDLARRRNDLEGANKHLETARAIYVRIGESLGEANATLLQGLVSTQQDTVLARATIREALQKYRLVGDTWGIAHSGLRLAQIESALGNPTSLPAAARLVLAHEARNPAQPATPGWRAYCASMMEEDPEKHQALRDEARATWTAIGAFGLVKNYLDFKIEVRP